MKLGYLGIDQYGTHYMMKNHPRKELLEQLGATYASKMYCDSKDGSVREKGYVISGHWINIYRVHDWKNVKCGV